MEEGGDVEAPGGFRAELSLAKGWSPARRTA